MEMLVGKKTGRATVSERSDQNGMATARPRLSISLLESILEEDAVEAGLLSKMKDETDLEIGCRETSKELSLCIRIEGFARLAFNDDFVIDDHVHPLVGERFTAKVDHHRHFSLDFVPFCDEESLVRAGVEVLAEAEAERTMNLKEGIDDRRRDFRCRRGGFSVCMRESARSR
jgi:hypothetical protein